MRILAIDPGTTHSAWVELDTDAMGILGHGYCYNSTIICEVIPTTTAAHLAVEMVACYGMPVGHEVFETCVWIGRFIERWGRQFDFVYRKQVKTHLCGSMKAKDPNIRQRLIDIFGKPGTKKAPGRTYGLSGDEWAALAVAVTWADTMRGPVCYNRLPHRTQHEATPTPELPVSAATLP